MYIKRNNKRRLGAKVLRPALQLAELLAEVQRWCSGLVINAYGRFVSQP